MQIWVIAIVSLGIGCAAPEDDFEDGADATEGTILGKADGIACSAPLKCGNPDAAHILFPGNPGCTGMRGCERGLAADDLYIPPTNGKPWGDTFVLGTSTPITVSGYSSGRIALLRRLALVDDAKHAVMLDPSWPDGARDFLGFGPQRGEDIVHDWLSEDPDRTFLLIHSTSSIGWSNYAALQHDGDIGRQVKVCVVTQPHGLVPSAPHVHDALVDPDAWNNGTCTWGTAK